MENIKIDIKSCCVSGWWFITLNEFKTQSRNEKYGQKLTVQFGNSAEVAIVVIWNFWCFVLHPELNISIFSVESFDDLVWPVCMMWYTHEMHLLLSNRCAFVYVPFVIHSKLRSWNQDTIFWTPFPNLASPTMERQLNEVPNCLWHTPNERVTRSFEWSIE